MKGLILAMTLLAVVVVACGASEIPTKRPPEAESHLESQVQAQPNARAVATPQQPTAREMATPQRPTEAPTKSTAATPSPTSTSTSAAKPTLRPQRPTEPPSTASTFEKPQEDPEPTPKVEDLETSVVRHGIVAYDYPPSLDMQIFDADIVVVATLVSVTADVQPDGDLFLPVQSLHFRSSQYLKGTGPTEFVVEVPITEHKATTRAKALEFAQDSIALRNTEYDSRPGILFLEGPLTSATTNSGSTNPPPAKSPGSTTTTYSFVPRILRTASWEYSIDTIDKVWAPAKNTASSPSDSSSGARSGSNTNPEYIIDGKTDPPATITLSALESRISEITAEISQGADIAGYEDCIGGKYRRENVYQDHVPSDRPFTVSSGADPATQVLDGWEVKYGDSVYRIFFEVGRDAAYFGTTIIDDDEAPMTMTRVSIVSHMARIVLYQKAFTRWNSAISCLTRFPVTIKRKLSTRTK